MPKTRSPLPCCMAEGDVLLYLETLVWPLPKLEPYVLSYHIADTEKKQKSKRGAPLSLPNPTIWPPSSLVRLLLLAKERCYSRVLLPGPSRENLPRRRSAVVLPQSLLAASSKVQHGASRLAALEPNPTEV